MMQSLVTVIMITYGHEHYIEQAIRGVFIQKTNFSINLIIANDGSPDGSDDVIKAVITEAPDNIQVSYVRHQKNMGMISNFLFALTQAKSQYVALCEGDDYWIDPLKLQRQVRYLEENLDTGMVCGNCLRYMETNRSFLKDKVRSNNREIRLQELFYLNPVVTLTTLFRGSFLPSIIDFFKKDFNPHWKMGDFPIWLLIAMQAKIVKLGNIDGVYRMLSESASQRNNIDSEMAFIESAYDIKLFFVKQSGLSPEYTRIARKALIAQKLIISYCHKNRSRATDVMLHVIKTGEGLSFKNVLRYIRILVTV